MPRKFEVRKSRDLRVPDLKCYQMDLRRLVDVAINCSDISSDFRELPSWRKFSADPLKAKGFFTRILEALFKGQGNVTELNADIQMKGNKIFPRVAMMFVGANNRQMALIDGIAKETLDAWHIVTLAGDRIISGRRVKNENCERIVKEEIKVANGENRSVLIISNRIAQRSFSVPEITELYLAYDGGEEGATIQKISRVLTSGDQEKVGHVFSLSFNPVRDDKFDSMILETAINLKNRNQGMEISDAIRSVLETFDIFDCTRSGAVKITEDKYLGYALDRGSVSKALGNIVDLYKLSSYDLAVIASGIVGRGSKGTLSPIITKAGKVHGSSKEGGTKAGVIGNADENLGGNEYEMTLVRARNVVITVMENLDVLVLGTESRSIAEAMKKIHHDSDYQSNIISEFGITHETIIQLLDREVINQDHADLMIGRF